MTYVIADRARDNAENERQRTEVADRIRARLRANEEKWRRTLDPDSWESRQLRAKIAHDTGWLAQLETRRAVSNDPYRDWKPSAPHVYETPQATPSRKRTTISPAEVAEAKRQGTSVQDYMKQLNEGVVVFIPDDES
jgi:hypothetical protein